MNMDYRRITFAAFKGLLISYLTLLILDYLDPGFVCFYLNLDYPLYLMVAFGVASFLYYTQEIEKSKLDRINRYATISFLGLLSLFILDGIFYFAFLEIPQTHLMITAIAFVVISFWLNRDKISLEGELEEELEEEREEEKRREEFVRMFSKVNRIPIFRSIAKWIYIEGWWYSVGLILIFLIGFGLRIFLANYMTVAVDEAQYTHLTSLGWLKYNCVETTVSGATYSRTPVYNLLNTIPYYFIEKPLLQLRLFNIIIFSTFFFPLYLIIKKIFKNKNVALLSVILVSINWYVIATTIVARSYTIFIILSLISLYLCYLIYLSRNSKKLLGYLVLITFVILINFHEGHAITSLHIIPILIFVLLIKIKHFSLKNKYLLFGLSIFCLAVIGSLYLRKDVFQYILDTLTFNYPNIYSDGLIFYGSVLSYINIIGILILTLAISYSIIYFLNYRKNFNLFLFSLYVCILPTLQIVFIEKNSYPRYLSYLTLPIIILVSYCIISLWKRKRACKVLACLAVILIISTSVVNISRLYCGDLDWQPHRPKHWQSYLKEVPENGTIITDFVGVPYFYRPDLKIYFLRDSPNDPEIIDKSGNLVYAVTTNEENKILFKNYIEEYINSNYVISKNQQYHYTTGFPKIMSIKHLETIVENSTNQEVYLIISHNLYEKKNQILNPELYEFIFKNSEVVEERFIYKSAFDNRELYNTKKRVLCLLVINKSSF